MRVTRRSRKLLGVMTTRIRLLVALVVAPFAVRALDAQIIRVPMPGEAALPISGAFSAGFLIGTGRFDAETGTNWTLGEAIQYRGSVEVGTRSGAFGLTGTLASVPIQMGSSAASSGTIQLRQVLATFRSPEGNGFYQIFEAGAGLSQWANYSGGAVLTGDQAAARNGLALVIGYGFGFALGDRASFAVVQDGATIIGSAEGLPAGARRSQNQYVTRMGLRYRFRGGR